MASPAPIVHLGPNTSLEGTINYATDSIRPVHTFLGVPYATPPCGLHRFKPTVPLKLWNGKRRALEYGAVCPQNMEMMTQFLAPFPVPAVQSEDCLYLNIWTPSLSPQHPLPVMVWIHGGSFIIGYSDVYVGTGIAAHQNVIHISINYRLGAFGFLSTGDKVCPGNMGLWDQIEALKWVKTYVAKFGGDPNNITVYGESAGAISIDLLLLTKSARGLFQKGILMSGGATVPATFWPKENALKYLLKHLKTLGCGSTNTTEILKFLQGCSAEQMVSLGDGFQVVHDDVLFCSMPSELYKTADFHDVDIITGVTSHEGAMFVHEIMQGLFGADTTPETALTVPSKAVAKQVIDVAVKQMFYRKQSNLGAVVEAIYERYYGNVKEDDKVAISAQLVDVLSHILFFVPNKLAAKTHAAIKPNTYMYLFDYQPSFSTVAFPDWVNTPHAKEIPYVLGEPFLGRIPHEWTAEDRRVSEQTMAYFANFARNSNPNSNLSKWPHYDVKLPLWPTYNDKEEHYMNINKDGCTLGKHCHTDDYGFWTQSIPTLISNVKAKY